MSMRSVRSSTLELRKCYPGLPRSIKGPRCPKNTGNSPRNTPTNSNMADGNGAVSAPQVPAGTRDPANLQPAVNPAQQDPPAGDGVDGQQNPQADVPVTPPRRAEDYENRIKALEEQVAKQNRERSASRRRHESAARSTKSARSRRSSRSNGSQPRRGDSPRKRPSSGYDGSRPRSGRRGYSPSSHRDSPRRSDRRRRSHTRDRRTRSRTHSRSHTRSRTPSRHRDTSARRDRRSFTRSPSSYRRSRNDDRSRRPTRTPSPRSLRERHGARRDTDRALEAQYPPMGPSTGKRLPTYKASFEPYKNLPPDLKQRTRDRKSRRDLSFPEFMCGYLNMVKKVLPEGTEVYEAIEHASQVAQDAATIAWPVVREWAQACLAHLEDGKATWTHVAVFDRDRMRLSCCSGKAHQQEKIPCPAFNADKCPESRDHSGEGRVWLHLCAICYYGISYSENAKNNHAAHNCRKKAGLRLIQDDARSDNKRKRNQYQSKKEDKDGNKPKN